MELIAGNTFSIEYIAACSNQYNEYTPSLDVVCGQPVVGAEVEAACTQMMMLVLCVEL